MTRLELFEDLTDKLGSTTAKGLLEFIEEATEQHFDNHKASLASKEDITRLELRLRDVQSEAVELRTEMQNEFGKVRAEMSTGFGKVDNEFGKVYGEFGKVRTEMSTELAKVRAEMSTEFGKARAETKADIEHLRNELRLDNANLRSDMERSFKEQTRWIVATFLAAVGVVAAVVKLL